MLCLCSLTSKFYIDYVYCIWYFFQLIILVTHVFWLPTVIFSLFLLHMMFIQYYRNRWKWHFTFFKAYVYCSLYFLIYGLTHFTNIWITSTFLLHLMLSFNRHKYCSWKLLYSWRRSLIAAFFLKINRKVDSRYIVKCLNMKYSASHCSCILTIVTSLYTDNTMNNTHLQWQLIIFIVFSPCLVLADIILL